MSVARRFGLNQEALLLWKVMLVGLDAHSPSYLENAKKKGGGSFYQMSYEEIGLEIPYPNYHMMP